MGAECQASGQPEKNQTLHLQPGEKSGKTWKLGTSAFPTRAKEGTGKGWGNRTAEKALESATNSVFIRECITSRQIDMPKARSQGLEARLVSTSELGVSDIGNLIPRNYTVSGFVCLFT